MRPSSVTSTTTAAIGSTYKRMRSRVGPLRLSSGWLLVPRGRGCALRVVDAQHDGGRRAHVRTPSVGVLDVHPRVADQSQGRGKRPGRVWNRHQNDIALGDLMVMLAEDGRAVDVVVDHETKLTGAFERHRENVDALAGQELAHPRQRPGAVRQAQVQFSTDRHKAKSVSEER